MISDLMNRLPKTSEQASGIEARRHNGHSDLRSLMLAAEDAEATAIGRSAPFAEPAVAQAAATSAPPFAADDTIVADGEDGGAGDEEAVDRLIGTARTWRDRYYDADAGAHWGAPARFFGRVDEGSTVLRQAAIRTGPMRCSKTVSRAFPTISLCG
jgi:hypothetical protein